jgi:hypothetical protein
VRFVGAVFAAEAVAMLVNAGTVYAVTGPQQRTLVVFAVQAIRDLVHEEI